MADPSNPIWGELGALGLAALPVVTLQLRTWYTQHQERLERRDHDLKLAQKIEHTATKVVENTTQIDEQARKAATVDSQMREFILQIARESEMRIRDMEARMVQMTKDGELSAAQEQAALLKVDALKEELAVAKFRINVLTDHIFELENRLGIPHSLPKKFSDSVLAEVKSS